MNPSALHSSRRRLVGSLLAATAALFTAGRASSAETSAGGRNEQAFSREDLQRAFTEVRVNDGTTARGVTLGEYLRAHGLAPDTIARVRIGENAVTIVRS